MNSTELVDSLVNAITEAVWVKIQARLNEQKPSTVDDREFYDRVMAVVDDIDFDERIDTHSIVKDVLSEIDVESTVREEINNTTFTVTVS